MGILDTHTNSFSTIDISNTVKGKWLKFNGAVVVDRKIYFVPYISNVIGVFDVDQNLFSTIGLERIVKFRDAVVINKQIVFCPYVCCDMLVLDTTTSMLYKLDLDYEFDKFDFFGSIIVNNKIYL